MNDKKLFYQFVIPSVGSMLVIGLYFIVDGVFVGRYVGENALAAINISLPFIAILTSVTMMITMGGATLSSICFGKNDTKGANNIFNISLAMMLIFAIFMSILSVLFPEAIAKICGSSDILLEETAIYIKYYVLFGIFFTSSMLLSVFVRNDGNHSLAFWGMIFGALANIFLDWLFIVPMGMGIKGAAIASGLGQILSCAILLPHFLLKRGKFRISWFKRQKGLILQILRVGTPAFVTQLSLPITIFCYNILVLNIFGEIGVASFSVVSYLVYVVIYVFIGVSQGVQPIISHSFGENNRKRELFFFKYALSTNIFLSIVVYIILIIFGRNIISVFSTDEFLIKSAYNCLVIYGISFVFTSINMIYTNYNISTKRVKSALIISISRTFIFNILFIFLIPFLFGDDKIWYGIIVCEIIVSIICISLNHKNRLAV